VLVEGEAGLGKTRLLAEFSEALAATRVRVTSSHCAEFAGAPYAPILDLLARLDPSATTLKSAQSRTAQFDQVAGAFRAATQRRAVVALIEDVHWTDPATLDLLAELAWDAAGRRILFVVTYRPEALGEEDSRAASVARLKRVIRRDDDRAATACAAGDSAVDRCTARTRRVGSQVFFPASICVPGKGIPKTEFPFVVPEMVI
jgi:predicted ATPase